MCSDLSQEIPSSAEEGRAEAIAEAGVVLANKIFVLINTTPRPSIKASPYRARPSERHPSSAEEGSRPYSLVDTALLKPPS
jgi:hypothetical protein